MARFEGQQIDGSVFAPTGASADALYELGLMYAAGRDVAVDLVTAHKWLNIAASRGNRHAREMRAELAAVFSQHDAAPLCDRLLAAGLPAGPVQSIDQGADALSVSASRIEYCSTIKRINLAAVNSTCRALDLDCWPTCL